MIPSEKLFDQRFRTRLALALGILGGILSLGFFVLFRPDPPTTFGVFYYAARMSLAGPIVYETGYGLWTYTPASLLYFYPYALLFEYETAFLVHRFLSISFAVFYGVVLHRFIDRHTRLSVLDKILITGFASTSVYPIVDAINGSFNIMFAGSLGLGWILLEYSDDRGGAVWALASIVKGFPVFWGAYLLRVRRWRATALAITTGISATLIGVLTFGIDAYIRFFTVAGESRVRLHAFRNGGSPDNEMMTPLRALAQLFPNIDPAIWPPIIAIIVISVTLIIYYLLPIDTLNQRATLLFATIVSVMFIMPTTQDMDTYLLYAPLLVLLYIERHTIVQGMYTVAAVILSYNIGRDELRAVSEAFGIEGVAMAVGEPVLMFAKAPTYALYLIYTAIILSAWLKGRETGRIDDLKMRFAGEQSETN
jgi:uncharacterized membrane protein YagU involved in acid resistance